MGSACGVLLPESEESSVLRCHGKVGSGGNWGGSRRWGLTIWNGCCWRIRRGLLSRLRSRLLTSWLLLAWLLLVRLLLVWLLLVWLLLVGGVRRGRCGVGTGN